MIHIPLRFAAVLPLLLLLAQAAGVLPAQAQSAAAESWTVEVSAQANIFGAGQPVPPDPGDGSGGLAPPSIAFPAGPGNVFRFDASGATGCCGVDYQPTLPPDGGDGCCGGGTAISGSGGIAGISGNSQMPLVGVFLGDGTPPATAPAPLPAFDHVAAPAELSPALGQPFFIGDGRTGNGSGDVQAITAPEGATHLYLGFADAGGFSGAPGAYTDNPGGLTVRVTMTVEPDGLTARAPATLTFTGQGDDDMTAYAAALSFVGQSDEGITAYADGLSFVGQNQDIRVVVEQALVFTGQSDEALVARAPAPLTFVGQSEDTILAYAGGVDFVGQGQETLVAYAGPLSFEGQTPGPVITQTVQLFENVPDAWSETFRANTDPRFSIDTTDWDTTPYRLTSSFQGVIVVPPNARVTLAGDSLGSASFRIDNFIALEIGDGPAVVLGAVAPVTFDGQVLERIAGGYNHAAGSIDLTPYFEPGVPTQLIAHAFDYGGTGYVSDVFLVIETRQ